jgi:TolB protein
MPVPPTASPIPPNATVSPADPKMAQGVIAFVSDRDGNREIYSIKPDGSQETRLTDDQRFNTEEPIWSPDGKWIAFASDVDRNTDIYVIELDGKNLFRLTTDPADDYFPYWSLAIP